MVVEITLRRMAVQGTVAAEPAVTIEDMTNIVAEPCRTVRCECGAHLVGNDRHELFEAAQSHIAHHHPALLGALGAELVNEMSQVRPGQ